MLSSHALRSRDANCLGEEDPNFPSSPLGPELSALLVDFHLEITALHGHPAAGPWLGALGAWERGSLDLSVFSWAFN